MRLIDADALPIDIDYHDVEDAPTMVDWIPCSERLPESDGCYLVTLDDKTLDVADYEIGTKLSQWHCGAFEDGKVTAWMPLPEPYSIESDGIEEEE